LPTEPLQCFYFARTELSKGGNATDPEEFLRHDAAKIKDAHNTLKASTQTQGAASETDANSILAVAQADLSLLVTVRLAHQTKRAAKSVKTRANPQDVTPKPPVQTDRQRLCAQMAEVVRRAGSGLERDARWRSGTAPGTRGAAEMLGLTGNSANAEVAAKERVNTVRNSHSLDRGPAISQNLAQARAMRAERFNKGGINFSRYLTDGLVGDGKSPATPPRIPLKPGAWAFVYWDEKIFAARGILLLLISVILITNPLLVLAFYSKEAGAGSRHAWQASTSAISALSYLVVQTFERMTSANRFRSIHRDKANIRAETFLHIPSTQFLCRLQEEVKFTDPQTILVDKKDWLMFQKFSKCLPALGSAIKELNSAAKGRKKA